MTSQPAATAATTTAPTTAAAAGHVDFPSELNLTADFGPSEMTWTDRYLTPWGSHRLVPGERLEVTVFGFADQFHGEENHLVLCPIAVFERIGHQGPFKWNQLGKSLREQAAENALPTPVRGRWRPRRASN